MKNVDIMGAQRNAVKTHLSLIISLIVVLLTFASGAHSETYYVRADGTAAGKAAATSCSSRTTAMSVATHESQSFSPGDTIILCNNGGVFRSTLQLPSNANGAPNAPITYNGRGTAVFSGANLVTNWVNDGGNIYRATLAKAPQQVFADGTFCDRKDSYSGMVNHLDWFWSSGTLYLFSASGNPGQAFTQTGIEAGARDFGIRLFGNDHITIRGVTARYANQNGVEVLGDVDFFTIRDSVFEWNYFEGLRKNGWDGISHDSGVIENNIARMNGSVGILVNTDHKDNVIRGNIVYENGTYQQNREVRQEWTGGIKLWSKYKISRVIIENNEVYRNGKPGGSFGQGVGIWMDMCGGWEGANIVRKNLVYENHSFGIFVEKSSNTIVSYNVVIDNADIKNTAGIGVKSSEEAIGENNFIHNNTIIGSKYYGLLCAVYDAGQYPRLYDNTFTNNIVVGSVQPDLRVENACANDGYYGSGNTYQYNTFGSEKQAFISWDHVYMSSYDQWEAAYGAQTYSIEAEPQFESIVQRKFWLRSSSPGIDAGLSLDNDSGYGLSTATEWPAGVQTTHQDAQGSGWEIGAYVFAPPNSSNDLIFRDGAESGNLSAWTIVN